MFSLKKTFEKTGQVEQKRRNDGLKKLYTADEQYLKVMSFRKIQQKTVLWSCRWSFCSLIRNGLCRNCSLTLLKHCGMILTENRTKESRYPINSVEMTFLFYSWNLISNIDFHTCYHQLWVCYNMHVLQNIEYTWRLSTALYFREANYFLLSLEADNLNELSLFF